MTSLEFLIKNEANIQKVTLFVAKNNKQAENQLFFVKFAKDIIR